MAITVSGFSVVLADRVRETTQTTGTGTYSLDGAATGFRTFVAGVGSGNRTTYTVVLGSNWETTIGLVTSGAPATVSRDSIIASSNAGSAVNWGAGVKDIFVDASAAVLDALQTNLEATAVNRIKTTVFTAGGTFTRDADCLFAVVRIVGGGGAGGGTQATNAGGTRAAAGGGGGAGEYAEGRFTAAQIGASQTITIGAGGTGVAGATGNTGGTTSFGALMTAIGGTGGGLGGASAADGHTEIGGGSGGTGGTGGSLRAKGGSGKAGVVRFGLFHPHGAGGESHFGGSTDGAIGQLYGGGGGARYIGSGQATTLAGFAGAAGVCIIDEFCRI